MPVMSARRRPATRGAYETERATAGRFDALCVPYPRPLPMPSPSAPFSPSIAGDRPATVPLPRSADLLGTQVSLIDYAGAMDWMDAMVEAGQRGYVCVAPVHTVMAAREDAD